MRNKMEIISFKIRRVQRVGVIKSSNVGVDIVLEGVVLNEVVNGINRALAASHATSKNSEKLLQVNITER